MVSASRQSTLGSQIHQNCSAKVKAAITHLVNLHLWASLNLSLFGLLSQLQKLAWEGRNHLFSKLEKCKSIKNDWKIPNNQVKDQWVTLWVLRSCPGPGGDPEPGPAHRDSQLWDFLEDEVELIKDNHLNSLQRQAPGRTGWGLPERLTLSWTKRSPEKHPLSPAAAPWPLDSFLRLCLQPKSRLTKQQNKCKQ